MHPSLPIRSIPNHKSYFKRIVAAGVDETVKVRSGDPHSGKIRVVCGACNNGWMSTLQTSVRPNLEPMLSNGSVRLLKAHRTRLASWTTMYAMVAEWANRDETIVATTADERRQFMDSLLPPANSKIWIGALRDAAQTGVYTSMSLPIEESDTAIQHDSAGMPLPNTRVTTVTMNKLLIHVLFCRSAEFARSYRPNHPGLIQLWPDRRREVIWPPTERLGTVRVRYIAEGLQERVERALQRRGHKIHK
jgi:hypothetical protein